MSILNRIHFDSNTKIKAPASPAKGRRSNESPRQIVTLVPCPAGHTSDAIPTGPAPRACQPIGGGLHGAEPTFGPALCQRTDNHPGPTRGGPPCPGKRNPTLLQKHLAPDAQMV